MSTPSWNLPFWVKRQFRTDQPTGVAVDWKNKKLRSLRLDMNAAFEYLRATNDRIWDLGLDGPKHLPTSEVPAFVYNTPMYPGAPLELHLFEPRYVSLGKEIWGNPPDNPGTQKFAFISVQPPRKPPDEPNQAEKKEEEPMPK